MTTNRSDVCVRGCIEEGRHFAACPSYGAIGTGEPGDCSGCVPSEPYRDLVVCERCRRKVRGMLRNAVDLVGRLESLMAQGKAVAYTPVKVPSQSATAPDPVGAELLDAHTQIVGNLNAWMPLFDWTTLGRLDSVLMDPELIDPLWAMVLDTHLVDAHGDRATWSLADAAMRWGIERRDRHVFPYTIDDDGQVVSKPAPVTEWYDPLLDARAAAQRAEISDRQLRTWVKSEVLKPHTKLRTPDGKVTSYFFASKVDAAAELMRARRNVGRAGATLRQGEA